MDFENTNLCKMSVKDLRKLVSSEVIFKGRLSSMKKKTIIDNIYSSEWWTLHKPVNFETEQDKLKNKLMRLERRLKLVNNDKVEPTENIPADIEIVDPVENEPEKESEKVEEIVEEKVEEKVEEPEKEIVEPVVESIVDEPIPTIEEQIAKAVQEALEKQKTYMISKMFS